MKTIAFLNQKGGVGKTASAVTVAHMMAQHFGKRVLLCDLDAQSNATGFFGSTKVMKYLYSLLTGEVIEKSDVGYSIEDLLMNDTMDVHKAIYHSKYKNLDYIPSFLTLSNVENNLQADVRTPQQFRLKNHLSKITGEYDFCVFDCAPSLSLVNINGLAMTDKVYIPMKCDAFSACGMAVARQLVRKVASYSPQLQLGGFFLTQWYPLKVNKKMVEFLDKVIQKEYIPIKIPRSKLVEETTIKQIPLLEYDKGYFNKQLGKRVPSKITQAYLKLTDYIIENA
jgi:chromosome partitioning protein